MNALDILFTTSRFNLTEVQAHFINPCCFGEDLAAWLRAMLAEKGASVAEVGQEDWGWFLRVHLEKDSYLLGLNGNLDPSGTKEPNFGEWRVIVKKDRTVPQWLRGHGEIEASDKMVALIEEILRNEQGFENIHREV